MNAFNFDEVCLLEIGTVDGLTEEQRSLLGPLEPDAIAARWFDGAVLAAYYFVSGDVLIAPLNYELQPGDEVTAERWASVVFDVPGQGIHLAGGVKRFTGQPPVANDPNYDAEPEWWVSN